MGYLMMREGGREEAGARLFVLIVKGAEGGGREGGKEREEEG